MKNLTFHNPNNKTTINGLFRTYTVTYEQYHGIKPLKSSAIKSPIFVIGSARSGTTVLSKCLSSHPNLAGAGEALALIHLCHMFTELHLGDPQYLRDYLDQDDILLLMQRFSDQIFSGIQTKQGKGRNVEHSPWYSSISPFIDLLYPDAIYVHITRDGREVVDSLGKSFEEGRRWAGSTLEERIKLWVDLVTLSMRPKRYSPDRYIQVDYRDLCNYPKGVLEVILNKVNEEFSYEMLKPLKIHHAPNSNSPRVGLKENDPRLEGKPLITKNYSWSSHWNNKDREIFIKLAGKTMKELYGDRWDK